MFILDENEQKYSLVLRVIVENIVKPSRDRLVPICHWRYDLRGLIRSTRGPG